MGSRGKALLLALTGLVAFASTAWAAPECPLGNATLSGTYLHTFQGTGYLIRPKGPLPSATGVLFAAAGRTTFDGAGGIVWRDSASLGGLTILDREFPGTYDIDPVTCLGIVSSPDVGEVARIIASPDGSEVYFLNSFPGVKVTGVFRQVLAGACTAASFAGSYRSLVDGAVYRGGAALNSNAPSLEFAGVGRLTATTSATGTGTFEWTTTDSTGGKVEHRIVRGTHTLEFFDCRVLAQVHEECVNGSCISVPAGSWTGRFAVSPAGDEVVYINTTTNVTVNGRLVRQ